MSRRGAKRPKWAVMPLAVEIEPRTWRKADIEDQLISLANRVKDAAATGIDQFPAEREALARGVLDELCSLATRVRDDPTTRIDVYSVEPEVPLRQKLDSGAPIAVVGPMSHITRRRAKRFSSAQEIVVLVGDWPAADKSEVRGRPTLALRLALWVIPPYARQQFEQEMIAALEDGCAERSGSRTRRTAWLIRNLIDLVCTGVRLRLRPKPLYCLPIWRTPRPDPEFLQNLEELLK